MSTVIVTGASGFIGRTTLEPLVRRGHAVHAVARHRPQDPGPDAVVWHAVDLLDAAATARLLAEVGAERLLHLAWYAQPADWFTSPDNVRWVEASIRLVREFAERGGKRAVVSGSCAEYDLTHGLCSEASTPLLPDTLYGVCKRAVESTITKAAPDLGLSVAWGRVFSVYGPDEHPQRLAASVIRSLLAGERASCSIGTQVRDYLYSVDVGAALVHLVDHPFEGALNIASGTPISVAELVRRIATLLGMEDRVDLGSRPTRPTEHSIVVGDAARLRDEVGWTPARPLDDGLRATIDWWRRQGTRR